MKNNIYCLICCCFCLLFTYNLDATTIWYTAFDDSPVNWNDSISYNFSGDILSKTIYKLRYFTVDGRSEIINPYLENSTLQDHFSQSWLYTGFETDNYKMLGENGGSHDNTLYITDDNDIQGGGRQTNYSGTPEGLITLGYSNSTNFADAGSSYYSSFSSYGSIVYRLDIGVKAIPEPNSLLLLLFFTTISAIYSLKNKKA